MSRPWRISLAVAIALCAMTAPVRAQAACAPAAAVDGDEALAAEATRLLARAGVAVEPAPGCASITVRLERLGDAIFVVIEDEDGRRGERTVRDLSTAVAIIESWMLREIAAPLASAAPLVPAEPVVPIAAAPATVPVVARASGGAPRWGVGVGVGFATAVGGDGSAWMGASLSGCVRFGPICVGALVRAGADGTASDIEPMQGVPHEGTGSQTVSASGVDALATVDLVISARGFVIRPGLGVGPGWTNVETASHHMHEVETLEHRGRVLRVGAHVALVRPVVRGFALELSLRADTALLRDDDLDGPASFGRATLGLRYEVP